MKPRIGLVEIFPTSILAFGRNNFCSEKVGGFLKSWITRFGIISP